MKSEMLLILLVYMKKDISNGLNNHTLSCLVARFMHVAQ